MSNLCSTTITIRCHDRQLLEWFYEKIKKLSEKDVVANDWGRFLGNIVVNAGIGTFDTGKESDLFCAGSLDDIQLKEDEIQIETSTKNGPAIKMWAKLVKKYLPFAEIVYVADEPGSAMYATNDPKMKDMYIIDSSTAEIETNYEVSPEDLKRLLKELLKTETDDLDALIDMLEASDYGDAICVYQWEYEDIAHCC